MGGEGGQIWAAGLGLGLEGPVALTPTTPVWSLAGGGGAGVLCRRYARVGVVSAGMPIPPPLLRVCRLLPGSFWVMVARICPGRFELPESY